MRDIALKAPGWTIRFFMVMRDNYLGSFTHFSTLLEYLDKRKRGILGDPLALKYREGKVSARFRSLKCFAIATNDVLGQQSNVLQVEITVAVENGLMLLPAGLPGYETSNVEREPDDAGVGTCVMLRMPAIQLHFRMNDYFMGDQNLSKCDIVGSDVVFRNVLQHRHYIGQYRGQLSRQDIQGTASLSQCEGGILH
jgi:hypothetical protein